jgi:hypothetical protein
MSVKIRFCCLTAGLLFSGRVFVISDHVRLVKDSVSGPLAPTGLRVDNNRESEESDQNHQFRAGFIAFQPGAVNICNKTLQVPCLQVTLGGDGEGTVTSNPKGISCPPTCVKTFLPYQQKITLLATPVRGSKFVSWIGGCLPSHVPNCVVSLSRGTFVTARFDK